MNKFDKNDPLDAATHERTALLQAVAVIILALILISYLEWMPI